VKRLERSSQKIEVTIDRISRDHSRDNSVVTHNLEALHESTILVANEPTIRPLDLQKLSQYNQLTHENEILGNKNRALTDMYNACMSINEKLLKNIKGLERTVDIKSRTCNIDQNTLIKRNEKLNQDLVTAMSRLEAVEIEFASYKNASTGKFLDYSDMKDENNKSQTLMGEQMSLILKLEQENKNLNQKLDVLCAKKKRTDSEGKFISVSNGKVADPRADKLAQENSNLKTKNLVLESDLGSLRETFALLKNEMDQLKEFQQFLADTKGRLFTATKETLSVADTQQFADTQQL
jgi:hypothetical protein